MGKVRRQRSQFHNKPIEPRSGQKQRNDSDISSLLPSDDRLDTVSLPGNLFNNLNIDHKLLAQKLPDFDTRSTITSRTFKGLNLKKKDKLKIRHEVFMQKIEAVKSAKKKAKEKKRREQTPIVGDMSMMEEALPTLELLMKEGSKPTRQNQPRKVRGVEKEKKRKNQIMSDMDIFKQVTSHPAFIENPTATITEHLHNKLKQEEEMDS